MTDTARSSPQSPLTGSSATRPPLSPLLVAPRLIFGAVAVALIAGLIRYARRGAVAVDLGADALLAAYLIWLFIEVPVTFRRAAAPPAESKTLLPYAVARSVVIVSGSLGPLPWTGWSPWLIVPMAVFVAGVTVRQIAIRTLGRFYSHHVMRQDQHQIVTGGLYRLIRHPAYAGMLLANVGFTVYFLNPFSAVAVVLLITAVIWRIRQEESVLWNVSGYPAYATGKARLLPGFW